ncbi:unnamed protein product [Tilletia controversa]|uniref:Major facilitator superfamily (MFS) profile domain-containing protein n=3 Tax=Tilletia TaxID=13289 RepID=A0A8X7MZP1_9BASI|nr:hypothetical protein CF336_g427 [Tilletia laevis]KAE8205640.1 hypothetical protein CF328_g377 [Tilletia controversa]KAE8265373.1 hypothetical protein A4X03_0g302 [Tilletia caries]KAE8208699.1 hypothetical protein CF335_g222 [Tilletia laevis]KAE8254617.1 hypothetical protein A4X06_0g811 [Tilletia controversa]
MNGSKASLELVEATTADALERETFTAQERSHVLSKLDMRLMPIMLLTVTLQYLDKTTLNLGNLLGLQSDLGLHGQEFSTLGSLFYIGYLIASPIHALAFQRFNVANYASINIIIWGIILMCHAACHNFSGMAVCRFFLGWFEGAITPAFVLITGNFYTQSEVTARAGTWYTGNGWAQIIGGAATYGLLVADPSKLAIARWREMFLIFGGITIVWGVFLLVFLPGEPMTMKQLDERERLVAIERIRESRTGLSDKRFKVDQMYAAFKDPRSWLFCLLSLCSSIANGGTSNFGSAIIRSFGFDAKKTALVGMSTGGAEVVLIVICCLISVYTHTRVIPGVLAFVLAIVGAAMVVALPTAEQVSRMAGYCLVFAFPVGLLFIFAWMANSVSGSTKKVTINALVQIAYCTGNAIGPQTFRAKDAPSYTPAKITIMAMFIVCLLCICGVGLVHFTWNKQRKQYLADAEHAEEKTSAAEDLRDSTDREKPTFRYPY